MVMTTEEIAEEIKDQIFFKSFSRDLLLDICSMMRLVEFKAGECLVVEGLENKSRYYLRQGSVEISQDGEFLNECSQTGEVFGEISAIQSSLSLVTIKSLSDSNFFAIQTDDFSKFQSVKKEHLRCLLLQEYCYILLIRFESKLEKAQLFEIQNGELYEAQKSLKMSYGVRVLLVEPNKKQQIPILMALGGTNVKLDVVRNVDFGRKFLQSNKYNLVLAAESCVEFLREVQQKHPGVCPVLLTGRNIHKVLQVLDKNRFVSHLISREADDQAGTTRYVLSSLGKLINNDRFGIDKYLQPGVEIQTKTVQGSAHRKELRDEMLQYFRKMGIRSTILDQANLVAEEMLMNAIYDAPVDLQGVSLFNHLSRKNEVVLEPNQYAKFNYASDGRFIVISVADPFGALTKDVVIDYLRTCSEGQGGSLNADKGGAGWGLYQTIENSDLTVFNVKKGVCSEIISLFNTDGKKRESLPSFHYFFS